MLKNCSIINDEDENGSKSYFLMQPRREVTAVCSLPNAEETECNPNNFNPYANMQQSDDAALMGSFLGYLHSPTNLEAIDQWNNYCTMTATSSVDSSSAIRLVKYMMPVYSCSLFLENKLCNFNFDGCTFV